MVVDTASPTGCDDHGLCHTCRTSYTCASTIEVDTWPRRPFLWRVFGHVSGSRGCEIIRTRRCGLGLLLGFVQWEQIHSCVDSLLAVVVEPLMGCVPYMLRRVVVLCIRGERFVLIEQCTSCAGVTGSVLLMNVSSSCCGVGRVCTPGVKCFLRSGKHSRIPYVALSTDVTRRVVSDEVG